MSQNDIDFVITWVDNNDAQWQNEFAKYKGQSGDTRSVRYRDTETLKYWFRSIEKYSPWVHKIYFVTCGQKPEWLNFNHPKLVHVKHEDYIPKEYLPTFSSHTIELNFHRIKGLSENFVYFNDDIFLNNETKPTDFFDKGLPKDTAVMVPNITLENPPFLVPNVDTMVINRHFKKHKVIFKNLCKFFNFRYDIYNLTNLLYTPSTYFLGFNTFHLANSFLKSTFEEVWKCESDILHQSSIHKFRQQMDVNQWVFQYWQFCKGKFLPRSPRIGKFFIVNSRNDLDNVLSTIEKGKEKMICINDSSDMEMDFDVFKKELIDVFERKFPEKSSFEL